MSLLRTLFGRSRKPAGPLRPAPGLSLYQYASCPFCVRVRREVKRLGIDLELRDTLTEPQHRRELIEGGGKAQVPCLRIEHDDGRVEWFYESADIIRFLRARFA